MALGAINKKRPANLRLSAPPKIVRGTVPAYQGLEEAKEILERAKSGKTLIYFDPDADGMIAGYFFALVLTKLGVVYNTYINSHRRHGFLLEPEKVRGWTVVNGDFLVPRSIVQDMVSKDVNLLSIDHHECEPDLISERSETGALGVVINNQYRDEDPRNHYQSGAGVTFEALRELYPWLDTSVNRALVGITLLTDVRNIQNEWAAGYLHELYNSKFSGYMQYLIEQTAPKTDFGFGVPKFDRNYVDFVFGPAVNSMLRYNEEGEAVKFILGGGYPKVDFRQAQRDFVAKMIDVAKVTTLEHLKVLEVRASDFTLGEQQYLSNFIGILCSRFSGDGYSAIGVSYDQEGNVDRASFRGNLQKSSYLEKLNTVLTGAGHSIAFGIIEIEPSEELWEKADALCAEAEEGTEYVQRYIEVDRLSQFAHSDISKIAELNSYLMSANRIKIRYTGEDIETPRSGAKYTEFSIDGVKVMCFDKKLLPGCDYIMPILDRNRVLFYLDAPYVKKYAEKIDVSSVNVGDNWYKEL